MEIRIHSLILKSVRYLRCKLGKRYVWSRGRQHRIMAMLDPVKVRYIIRQKDLGRSTVEIAREMRVCGRWIQKLYARYLDTGKVMHAIKVLHAAMRRFHEEIQRKQRWFADIHELVHWWLVISRTRYKNLIHGILLQNGRKFVTHYSQDRKLGALRIRLGI